MLCKPLSVSREVQDLTSRRVHVSRAHKDLQYPVRTVNISPTNVQKVYMLHMLYMLYDVVCIMCAHTSHVGIMMGTWLHHDVPMLLFRHPRVHVTLVVWVTLIEISTPAFHSDHVHLQHHTNRSVDGCSVCRIQDNVAALTQQRYTGYQSTSTRYMLNIAAAV
jgi:hypothetical protein